MACARWESIFCCPREREDFFLRRDFFDDAMRIFPVTAALACFLGVVFPDVFLMLDFFAVELFDRALCDGALCPAYERVRAASRASEQTNASAAFRTCRR